jgi:hypothetical protein
METALDLLDSLKGVPDVKVHLLVVTSIDAYQAKSWQGISEVLSPVRALLSARSQRGNLAIYRGTTRFEREECVQRANCTFRFLLNRTSFWLPLGWQLASPSRRAVELHSGISDRSETPFEVAGGDIKAMLISQYLTLSDRSACGVVHALEGGGDRRLRC